MLKKLLLTTLLIGSFFSYYAQNAITGLVTDSTNAPVSYCAMALLNAKDSSLVKGNVTDENGKFTFQKIAIGTYLIKFSNVSYKTSWSNTFTVDSLSQLTLAPQVLKTEGINLKEVSIAVAKPIIEFKKGIVVMNIENNIISGGNTVFELLKRIPGVTVDAQNNISVNGRGGVQFLMDGRLQQIPATQMVNLLMSMPAESVSSIELIKNPPAKYDAAGTGGLINLVMKKAKLKGYSGSISQSCSRGDNWRGGTFASLNYKSNKLTLFTNLNCTYLQFETNNYFQRKITDSVGTFEILSQGRQTPLRKILYGNAGVEYELTKKTIIGLNVNGNIADIANREDARLAVIGGNIYNYDYIDYDTDTKQYISNPSVNINAQHKFDSLTQLQFSADYTKYNEQYSRFTKNQFYNNSDIEVQPINQFGTEMHNDFNIYTQKLDLTRSFKRSFNLETGFKSSFVDNASTSKVQLTDPATNQLFVDSNFSNKYRYHERILAGYVTLTKSFNKLELSAGLRAEHTLIDASNKPKPFSLHREYINFFPSASVDWKLNAKNSVQTSYSYRIGRPGYDQLNPTRVFNDQFSNGAGNPQLKPQFNQVINLDYNYDNFINLNASYQTTKDHIYYYAYGDPTTKATIDTIFNFATTNDASVGLFIGKQIKWFNFQIYGAYGHRQKSTIINDLPVSYGSYFYNGNATLEFFLPKDIKLQVQGYYNSDFRDGVQLYFSNGSANLTIAKSFFNKTVDVSLSLYDVFYSEINRYNNQVGDQYSFYKERNDSRRFRLFILWKFGKMRINKNLNNNDRNDRLKNVN
ncbi:MAG: outer membrane beta-barrel protein [Bacteroidota bacterium]